MDITVVGEAPMQVLLRMGMNIYYTSNKNKSNKRQIENFVVNDGSIIDFIHTI